MKKIILLLTTVIIFGGLIFTAYQISSKPKTNENTETKKLKITTSFYPLYYLASEIGGGLVEVTNITPPGAEPHDYEITTQDVFTIKKSNLLILTGSLEPWATKINENLKDTDTRTLTVGNLASNSKDPHFWLSPLEFSRIADEVTQNLLTLDPANSERILQNATLLNTKLLELDNSYREGLKNCVSRSFVTSHDAFGYLAEEYNLIQVSIAGISTEEEPSLKKLAEVAAYAKQNNVTHIFFESLLSPKMSETIAKEVGAKTLVLNPIEGLTEGESSAGYDYISIMKDNLVNLQIALQCQ